jgi:tetratricopeptide (TPR) repeat protein
MINVIFFSKLLGHPKASQLLGAMFGGGMFGGEGGAGMFGGDAAGGGDTNGKGGLYEDDEMDQDRPPASQTSNQTNGKKPETKPAADPKSHLTEAQRDAEREKELGNEAYKKKEFDAALGHYEKAIELDPTNITYLNNKAAVYYEQNKIDECIKTCEQAVDIGRENKADYALIAK